MKRYFSITILAILLGACGQKEAVHPVIAVAGPIAHEVAVTVAMDDLHSELGAPMYVRVFDETDSANPVPHETDDLDGDGVPDALFLLVGPSTQPIRMMVVPSATPAGYPSRAQAVLAVRQGGRFEDGIYTDGSDYVRVEAVDVPEEQVQDSDWAMYEGPVWESDKIGWRFYLDHRNRTDIFGKKSPELVLAQHHEDYHTVSDWGADILKVGESLGIGSPAIATDDGPQVIDNAVSRRIEIVANGPLRSIIRTTYTGWMVGNTAYDVISELENRAGRRWTEQRVDLAGDSTDVVMLTGIVKHPAAPALVSGSEAGIFFAYTYGAQTDQGQGLGMAVLVPSDYTPDRGPEDDLTHLVRMQPAAGKVAYRYMASWEMEPGAATDAASFESMVRTAASAWAEERALSVTID